MRLRGILEGIALVQADLHMTIRNHIKQGLRRRLIFIDIRNIMPQRRAGNIERAFLREQERRKIRHRTGGIPEAHHHPARGEAVQRRLER